MGCAQASFTELLSLAVEFGMDFVELRGLEGTLDLPEYFSRKPIRVDSIRPPVRLVATNLRLTEATGEDIDQFLRFVDVANALGAPYVRVFGGGEWGDVLSREQLVHGAQVVAKCREAIRQKGMGCEMLLETHSGFSSSSACLRLNEMLHEPLLILWDSHNNWRAAGESPAETWQAFGSLGSPYPLQRQPVKESPRNRTGGRAAGLRRVPRRGSPGSVNRSAVPLRRVPGMGKALASSITGDPACAPGIPELD